MKFAVVVLPDHAECELCVNGSEKPLRVIVLRRGKELAVLAMLLFCAGVLMAAERLAPEETEYPSAPSGPGLAASSALARSRVEQRTVARHWDGLRALQTGDLVIMDGATAPTARPVAAAPNQTVMLRRGHTLHALYLVGDTGCVVAAGNESRLLRSEPMRANAAPASLVSAF